MNKEIFNRAIHEIQQRKERNKMVIFANKKAIEFINTLDEINMGEFEQFGQGFVSSYKGIPIQERDDKFFSTDKALVFIIPLDNDNYLHGSEQIILEEEEN